MLADHARAFILADIGKYFAATGWSARRLGLRVAGYGAEPEARARTPLSRHDRAPTAPPTSLAGRTSSRAQLAPTGRYKRPKGCTASYSVIARPLSPAQLAEIWECSTTLVYDLLNAGKLQGFRLGKLWRIPFAAVEEYEARPVELPVASVELAASPPDASVTTVARIVRMGGA